MSNDTPPPFLAEPVRLVDRDDREACRHHRGKVFWLTGPSGAGKSTLAHAVEKLLFAQGVTAVTVLDGDRIRGGLCSDLGFSAEARHENIRRVAHVARLFVEEGLICLCAFISPFQVDRRMAAEIIGPDDFYEIFVDCPQAVCEERDVKGFYELARQGVIKNYTGISSPYQAPEAPHLTLNTDTCTERECSRILLDFIVDHSGLNPK